MNKLDEMMVNIQVEGKFSVLENIEKIKDAIERFKTRDIYYLALKKLRGLNNKNF